MAPRIVLTGASGKIGGAVLAAILDYALFSPSDLIIATSSKGDSSLLKRAASLGAEIRQSNYESIDLMTKAFAGCERLFLVSTPHINLDYHDCAKGGRESHHFGALEAAKRAGISHVYYTSLAFSEPSKAGVMRAHLKTEEFLKSQKTFDFTIIREGIYNESWPLYLGYFKIPTDPRDSVIIGPDGPISWTSIPDLGLANALIVTSRHDEWAGKTLYLSAKTTLTITEVAKLVAEARHSSLSVEVFPQQKYIKYYTQEQGMDSGMVEWWSSTYLALQDYECSVKDSHLEELLARKGLKPTSMRETISDQFRNSSA